MAELVTVYKTLAGDVSRVMRYLQRRNLNPVVLDDIEQMGPYREQTHQVRIAVPETEREMAAGILNDMEQHEQARLAPHIKVAGGVIMLVIVVGGFVALVGLLDHSGKWFAALWLALTAVAAAALVRWAWRKKPKGR